MNRKGHTPTVMLLILTIALIVVTISSFFSYNKIPTTFSSDSSEASIALVSHISAVRTLIYDSMNVAAKTVSKSASPEEFRIAFEVSLMKADYGSPVFSDLFSQVRAGKYSTSKIDGGFEVDIPEVSLKSDTKLVSLAKMQSFNVQYIYK
mgnify:CR=1 FL=1